MACDVHTCRLIRYALDFMANVASDKAVPRALIGACFLIGLSLLLELGVLLAAGRPVPTAGTWTSLGLNVFFIVLLLRRSRLAWQYGRLVMLLRAAQLGITLPNSENPSVAVVGVALVSTYLGISGLLSVADSTRYFHLFCPACDSAGKADDFLFKTVRCKTCGTKF